MCGMGEGAETARGATADVEVPATGEEGRATIGETVRLGSNRMSKSSRGVLPREVKGKEDSSKMT
jgi:hypothetical protein